MTGVHSQLTVVLEESMRLGILILMLAPESLVAACGVGLALVQKTFGKSGNIELYYGPTAVWG